MELNFSKIVIIELRPPYAEPVWHKGDLCTCEKCRYLKTRHFGLLIGMRNAVKFNTQSINVLKARNNLINPVKMNFTKSVNNV